MKAMIIPIAIGLLAGLGGGSGYAYMKAAAKYTADSTRMADSVKTHADSAAHDSTGQDSAEHGAAAADSGSGHGADSASLAEQVPMTPADSLRAVVAARKSGAAHAGESHAPSKAADASHAPEPKAPGEAKPAPKPAPGASGAANLVKDARDQALQTALPEARLAKIFGAMPTKDAAKVLDQMTDGDVRAILAMMGDRQAAAILAAFPPARAAAITKGAAKAPEGHTP